MIMFIYFHCTSFNLCAMSCMYLPEFFFLFSFCMSVAEPKDFVYLLDNCPHDWLFSRCMAVVELNHISPLVQICVIMMLSLHLFCELTLMLVYVYCITAIHDACAFLAIEWPWKDSIMCFVKWVYCLGLDACIAIND